MKNWVDFVYIQSCFLGIYFVLKNSALVPLRDQVKNKFHRNTVISTLFYAHSRSNNIFYTLKLFFVDLMTFFYEIESLADPWGGTRAEFFTKK